MLPSNRGGTVGSDRVTAPGRTTGAAGLGRARAAPSISLPKGGGAIRGIGEKFAANPVTGTGSMTVPLPTSPGRSGFGPQLALCVRLRRRQRRRSASAGASSLPSITRKTDKGLPRYDDDEESDVFVLSGAEDLVPVPMRRRPATPRPDARSAARRTRSTATGRGSRGCSRASSAGRTRTTRRDALALDHARQRHDRVRQGRRLADRRPRHDPRAHLQLADLRELRRQGQRDRLRLQAEDGRGVDVDRCARAQPRRPRARREPLPEADPLRQPRQPAGRARPRAARRTGCSRSSSTTASTTATTRRRTTPATWLCRNDPFSTYRAGFEVRTYRLCRRVLMFHHFPDEPGRRRGLPRPLDRPDLPRRHRGRRAARAPDRVVPRVGHPDRATARPPASGYLSESLPPLEFDYSEPTIDDEVRERRRARAWRTCRRASTARPTSGSTSTARALSGVLTEQADAWFYKREPRSTAGFGPLEPVAVEPSAGARSATASAAARPRRRRAARPRRRSTARRPGFFERTADGELGARSGRSSRCRTSTGTTRTCASST